MGNEEVMIEITDTAGQEAYAEQHFFFFFGY